MLGFSTAPPPNNQRTVSGGIVTLIGILLLGIPFYDIWDDFADLNWSLLITLAENAVFLLLAGGVTLGGVWLVRNDWQTDYVQMVAKWTISGWIATTVLFGWVV